MLSYDFQKVIVLYDFVVSCAAFDSLKFNQVKIFICKMVDLSQCKVDYGKGWSSSAVWSMWFMWFMWPPSGLVKHGNLHGNRTWEQQTGLLLLFFSYK